ncbi:MAG TPA: 30S ribosome-binding factor RbfA [Bryobacteraceae bacterium]|nr:30S ribosome-binding factor RbfA [Bryobacteraceae bacterium]
MENHRAQRVSEALREELSEMIGYELADPRIGEAVVTEVLVSPDMKHAQVRLHFGPGTNREKSIQALDGARHFLRSQIVERLNLFRVPELHFEADAKIAANAKMEHLLKRMRRGRPRDQKESSS